MKTTMAAVTTPNHKNLIKYKHFSFLLSQIKVKQVVFLSPNKNNQIVY